MISLETYERDQWEAEAPTNEAPKHPLSLATGGKGVSNSFMAFRVPVINHPRFHSWQERSVMQPQKQGCRGVEFILALLSWKLPCKAAEVHRCHAGRAVFPLGHVLEGIAGRKSSWMSKFNRSASHYSGLSLTLVSPSLPLNLPLDKIYLVGDMFSPKEIFWFKHTSSCKSQYLHFYGFHGALFTV